MPDVSLDRPEEYQALDREDMYGRVAGLAAQLTAARTHAGRLTLPSSYGSCTSVLIAGMGGSAIGGSLLESYGAWEIPVPLTVWRRYGLPDWVDEKTLVIGVSYSGNTEETVSAFEEAAERGAKLLLITTGGKLGAFAHAHNIPALSFDYPAQPRAALGYLFTPLLCIFQQLGFLANQDRALDESVDVVGDVSREWSAQRPTESNPAKQLATNLVGHSVVIYGAEYLAAVAHRWKTQLNENAKTWAFFEEFSELNHNAIVGYAHPPKAEEYVVLLSGSRLSERMVKRAWATEELLKEFQTRHSKVEARGQDKLAQMFSLICLGDYVSYYLALLNAADPTEIKPIDYLKGVLSQN